MLRTCLFTAFIGIVFFTADRFNYLGGIHSDKWLILGFFFALALLQHRLMEFGFRNNREKFVEFYLTATVARFLLSIGCVAAFLYVGLERVQAFVLTFFLLYIFYTCFEIYGLYSNLRRDLKS